MWNSQPYLTRVIRQTEVDFGLSGHSPIRLGETQVSHGVWTETVAATDLPFGSALHCLVRTKPPTPYAYTLRVPIAEPVRKGDCLLLSVWARCAINGMAEIAHAVERADEPFEKLLWAEVTLGPGWTQSWYSFLVNQDFQGNECRYQLLFRNRPQELQVGGLVVLRVPNRHRENLPDSRILEQASSLPSAVPDDFYSGLKRSAGLTSFLSSTRELATLRSARAPEALEMRIQPIDSMSFTHTLKARADDLEERPFLAFPLPGGTENDGSLHVFASLRSPTGARVAITLELIEIGNPRPLHTSHHALDQDWLHLKEQFPFRTPLDPDSVTLFLHIAGPAADLEVGGLAVGAAKGASTIPIVRMDYQALTRTVDDSIDRVRRRTLTVRVQDAEGGPVSGAKVTIKQQNLAFGLGTSVRTDLFHSDNETYRKKLIDLTGRGAGFNRATPEWRLSWIGWDEQSSESQQKRAIAVLRQLRQHGLMLKGHYLVSGNFSHLPSAIYLQRGDKQALLRAVRERLKRSLRDPEFKTLVKEWDLLNEPFSLPDLVSVLGLDGAVSLFQEAAEIDPNITFFVNENRILELGGLDSDVLSSIRRLMERLRDETGCRLGLGLQGHFRSYLPTDEQIEEVLDRLSDPGWELRISELDVVGVAENETADFLDRFATVLMRTPAVSGLDLWGFWDGASWCDNALLFRNDWSLKPAGKVYLQRFFQDWWTDETRITDEQGRAEFRVFRGTHAVQVSHHSDTATMGCEVGRDDLHLDIGLTES